MKPPKPGQLLTYKKCVMKAKKKECGCSGCYFEHSLITCPAIFDTKTRNREIDCFMHSVILIKV